MERLYLRTTYDGQDSWQEKRLNLLLMDTDGFECSAPSKPALGFKTAKVWDHQRRPWIQFGGIDLEILYKP